MPLLDFLIYFTLFGSLSLQNAFKILSQNFGPSFGLCFPQFLPFNLMTFLHYKGEK